MEISEIKERLTIANVLHYYGLKTDDTSGEETFPFRVGKGIIVKFFNLMP